MSDEPQPHEIFDIFLQPGDTYWGDRLTRIRTLLGSCVSIALWHPRLREGGMCHFMLPSRTKPSTDGALDGRYAEEAMEMLVAEMKRVGSRPGEYEAKLFGGGSMFISAEPEDAVGERNIRVARDLAAKHGLRVVSESLGGPFFWRLHLEMWSGNVWVRKRPVSDYGKKDAEK